MENLSNYPINFGQYGNTGTIDTSSFSRTGSAFTDPQLFELTLQQMINKSAQTLLSNNNETDEDDPFAAFSFNTNSSSSFLNGIGGVTMPSDLTGGNILSTSQSLTMQMIARSGLIGKSVTATDPENTKQTISGKVEGVSVDKGILLINVGGIEIPPEYLLSVAE